MRNSSAERVRRMARRPSLSPPSYRLHRQSSQAIVTLRDSATGRRRDMLLGPYGTAASRAEYARVIAEWETANRFAHPAGSTAQAPGGSGHPRPIPDLTVNEMLAAFLRHCHAYYVKGGRPTSE